MSTFISSEKISLKRSKYEENMGALLAPYVITEMLMMAKCSLYNFLKNNSLENLNDENKPYIISTNKDYLFEIIDSYLKSANIDFQHVENDNIYPTTMNITEINSSKIPLRAKHSFRLLSLNKVVHPEDSFSLIYSFANYPVALRYINAEIKDLNKRNWGRIPARLHNEFKTPIDNSIYGTDIPSMYSQTESESTLAARYVLEMIALSADDEYENFIKNEYADDMFGDNFDIPKPKNNYKNINNKTICILVVTLLLSIYTITVLNIG